MGTRHANERSEALANVPECREEFELSKLSNPRTRVLTTQSRRRISSWWHEHVHLSVDHQACRDHFANERTYLAHLRTANAFANFGVLLAALFRIKKPTDPHPFSLYGISIPLAVVSLVIAIIAACIGMHRFLQYQKLMALTKASTGGWDLLADFGLCLLVGHLSTSSEMK